MINNRHNRLPVNGRNLTEELNMHRSDKLMTKYLIENGMDFHAVEMLTESNKTAAVSDIATAILNTVSEKIKGLDLVPIFKSKGDIKNFINLNELQEAIQTLESLAAEYNLTELKPYVDKIVQAMLNINKLANDYKDAFRNKKVLLMTHYVGIVQTIIACTAYLISVTCDVSVSGEINPKPAIKIDDLLYFTALDNFNHQAGTNGFKAMARDVSMMRECYTELSVEELHMITEAEDMVTTLVNGAKDMLTKLKSSVDGNGMLSRLLYKASGVIMLILSLRDSFYTTFRLGTPIGEIVNYISTFVKSQMVGSGNRINNFSKYFSTAVEAASDAAEDDIIDEDRAVVKSVVRPVSKPAPAPVAPSEPNEDFDF